MDNHKVYAAINAVQAALQKDGITKDRVNKEQRFTFRGIDDIYNALSPMLAAARLCMLPRMIARTTEQRTTKSGSALYVVTVEAEFDFVSAEDGSRHTIRTFGEASDMADKATNKAMSAAYKYAAIQAFAIPTEGDNDADLHTHEPTEHSAVTDIRAAETLQELESRFIAGATIARAARDKELMRQIVEAKDVRKQTLLFKVPRSAALNSEQMAEEAT